MVPYLSVLFYHCFLPGGSAVQKALGRGESMVVEVGCVAAVSEACKIVAEERTGLIREPPYPQGFTIKITGEHSLELDPCALSWHQRSACPSNHDASGKLFVIWVLLPVPRTFLLVVSEAMSCPFQIQFLIA